MFRAYIHTYMHTYIRTYVHTRSYTQKQRNKTCSTLSQAYIHTYAQLYTEEEEQDLLDTVAGMVAPLQQTYVGVTYSKKVGHTYVYAHVCARM